MTLACHPSLSHRSIICGMGVIRDLTSGWLGRIDELIHEKVESPTTTHDNQRLLLFLLGCVLSKHFHKSDFICLSKWPCEIIPALWRWEERTRDNSDAASPSLPWQGLDYPCVSCSSLKAVTWGMVTLSGSGPVLTTSSSPVPRASHEVCIWRISPLVPSGPLHGSLWEGKAQGCEGGG